MKPSQKYKIFISHRLEDRAIANVVSGILRLLGKDKLEPFVCADIPGGVEWRDWIEEKIVASDIMLFIYTQEGIDWSWCFYEIGLFRRLSDSKSRPIICIQNPSITSLPSPLEKYQAYKATEEDMRKFLEDLFFKGEFTDGDRINQDVFVNDNVSLTIQDFLRASKQSRIEDKFYTRRALFDLRDSDQEKNDKEGRSVLISGDPFTMQEILLSPGNSTNWIDLYAKFNKTGQSSWLDQIKESIENLRKGESPIYVMKPFNGSENKKYIPILTRVEQMPSDDGKRTIPLRIYYIFLPCSAIEKTCDLTDVSLASDPGYLLKIWKTILPTSVIRVKWKGKSSAIGYLEEDMLGPPIAYAINPSFADLYNFNYQDFPDPDGKKPLTATALLELVEKFIVDSATYIPKIKEDQAEISQRIIFEGSNAFAKVPLKFNDKHPSYPNASFLPCLVSKSTVGDTVGPHITYLAVIYVRGGWVV